MENSVRPLSQCTGRHLSHMRLAGGTQVPGGLEMASEMPECPAIVPPWCCRPSQRRENHGRAPSPGPSVSSRPSRIPRWLFSTNSEKVDIGRNEKDTGPLTAVKQRIKVPSFQPRPQPLLGRFWLTFVRLDTVAWPELCHFRSEPGSKTWAPGAIMARQSAWSKIMSRSIQHRTVTW